MLARRAASVIMRRSHRVREPTMKLSALLPAAVVAVVAASAPTIAPVVRAAKSHASRNLLLGDLHWRLLGPFRAGRTLAVTGVPGQPKHFYFGSVNGGVWETN